MSVIEKFALILCLFFLTLFVLLSIYVYWFDIVITVKHLQRSFHQQLVSFLLAIKREPIQMGGGVILFSLLYGVIHAAGPGHGKFIITTYLVTQTSQIKKSLILTILSALVQALVAILLVSILFFVINKSVKWLKIGKYGLELISYFFIVLIGILICYRCIKKFCKIWLSNNNSKKITNASLSFRSRLLNGKPSEHCSCCHHIHIPNDKLNTETHHLLSFLGIIVSVGLRPCSGALLVLVFSYSIGLYLWGIIATLMMAAGTAITTSILALIVCYGRQFVQNLIRNPLQKKHENLIPLIINFITLIGGVVFILMGIIFMLSSSYPTYSFGNPLLS